MFLTAILLLGFPRELPGSAKMRAQAIEEGHLPKRDNKLRGKWKDIVPATSQLLKNITYLSNSLALAASSLYGGAVSAFIAKFVVVKYAVNPGMSGPTLGAIFLVGASAGIVFGGFFVRRFNLKKSCKLSAKYCFVFALLSAWTAFLFMIPGCDKVNLAGVVTPYHNRLLQEDKLQLPT